MRHFYLVMSLLCLIFAGCDLQQDVRIGQTRAKLIGVWLEEADPNSDSAQRLLTLGSDGKFKVEFQAISSGTFQERMELGGEWSYDGTNLKRRYLEENGRQFSGGKMRYATFPIQQITESEFVMEDNIRKRQVKYRRVEDPAR